MKRSEKEKRATVLLKDSMLSKPIKDILKKNIKKYPNAILDGMLESLSRESISIEKLGLELMRFDADSAGRWEQAENNQIKESEKAVEDIYQSIISSSV